jgi:CHAD domain-containing protein
VAEPRVQKAAAAAAAAGAAAVAGKLAHDKLAARGEPDAYRLLAGESVPDGMRRAARGRIDHALAQLGNGDEPDKSVHEARKDMKKLRSLLRLARPELGGTLYRRENTRLRDAGRGLSGVRDAKAMLDGLDALEEAGLHRSTAERVRRALLRHKASFALDENAAAAAAAELQETRRQVADWPLERDGWRALEAGLRRMYGRGRRAMRAAEAEPSTGALHDWRKRVKDLWYLLTLLCESWSAVLGPEADQAHELSRLLGDDHDLALLRDFATEHGVTSARLEAAIDNRRTELQGRAFALGHRLYAEKPRTFSERLRSYWEAWRAEPAPAD